MCVELYDYQLDAVRRMKNGCILCGGVGSGKSRTALAFYYLQNGGDIDILAGKKAPTFMPDTAQDLYIITTAKKRDSLEWDEELVPFILSRHDDPKRICFQDVYIDSWNNIGKYTDVYGAFFIFDEQRVVGKGAWVKHFLKIAKHNEWILLSATPGDTWMDYIPVFIANGFYRNRGDFIQQHVVYKPFMRYPVVSYYINTGILMKHRNDILVDMDFVRPTIPHHEDILCDYDRALYKQVTKERWNPYLDKPIENVSELCKTWQRVVNSDISRQKAVQKIVKEKERVIIFYNYDYELDILRNLDYGSDVQIAEWNGHKHEPIPKNARWVYLVNYLAGAEGWNCITTDTIIFYSQNYSWRIMEQAAGRIDRMNTPYKDLYFYHLKSRSHIDAAISRALEQKKIFNESRFVKW